MYVWEITIHLDGEYVEISNLSIQEKYHNFINEILNGYDTHYQVEEHDDKVVINFMTTTKEKLEEIINRHQQIFQDLPLRDEPLKIEYRIYEQY